MAGEALGLDLNALVYQFWQEVRDDLTLPARLDALKEQLYSPVQKRRAFHAARRRIRDGTHDALDFIVVNAYAASAIVSRATCQKLPSNIVSPPKPVSPSDSQPHRQAIRT